MKFFHHVFLIVALTFLTLPETTIEYPLRYHAGIVVKDASVEPEHREPLLCWIVKIHTRLKCGLQEVSGRGTSGHQESRQSCGKGKEIFMQHVKEIAEEINLAVVHIFTKFPDHVLMCHLEEQWKERLLGNFPTLSNVGRLHPGLLTTGNESLFLHHKGTIENRLSAHEEIVSFQAEYKHQRKTRGGNIDEDSKDTPNYKQLANGRRDRSLSTGGKENREIGLDREAMKFDSELRISRQKDQRNPGVITDNDNELFYLLKSYINHTGEIYKLYVNSTRILIIFDDRFKLKVFQNNAENDTSSFEMFDCQHPYHPCKIRTYHKVLLNKSWVKTWYANDIMVLLCKNVTHTHNSIFLFINGHLPCSNHTNNFMKHHINRNGKFFDLCQIKSLWKRMGTKCNESDFNSTTTANASCAINIIICFDIKRHIFLRSFPSTHSNRNVSANGSSSGIQGIHICDNFIASHNLRLNNLTKSSHTQYCISYVLQINDIKSRKSKNGQDVKSDEFIILNDSPIELDRFCRTVKNSKDLCTLIELLKQWNERLSPVSSSSSWPPLPSRPSLHRDKREKRSVRKKRWQAAPPISFNDPAFPHQWHLRNQVTPSMDLNVTGIWARGYNGSGVVVCVVDDGLQWKNPDLKSNYDYKGSWDFNDDDPDPSPSTHKTANHHGTRCAGEIAAVANNNKCGVGVAYGAKISGIRVLDGEMTDSLEAEAFNKGMEINDVYSCSWGPEDDGKTVDGPHLMAARAMKHGIEFGRHGYGSIYVVASGNGGFHKDNCNFDGYANSIYTVTIGAVDESGAMPYYAEECASMLGVTFSSGGANNKRDIVTTDWTVHNPKGCTERHTGTSAAAPLAAGMIALMLQARPCLTWRDIQYLIILTAKKVDIDIAHWQRNGAGLHHSHKHGFGLLSSWRMVNAARVWQSVPWMTSYSHTDDVSVEIPKGSDHESLVLWREVKEEDVQGYSLFILESVQVTVSLGHPFRGKLKISIVSPSNTRSIIAAPRPNDNSSSGFQDWTFTTVRCWGESPVGNWTLVISDTDSFKYGKGKLTQWRLTLFGTPMSRAEFDKRRELVEAAMSGEFLAANKTIPCPHPTRKVEEVAMFSEKTLKILILCGVFCLIMAVYETFEYMCCYNEDKEEYKKEVEQARQNRRATDTAMRALENEYSGLPVTDDTEMNSITHGVGAGRSIALLNSYNNRGGNDVRIGEIIDDINIRNDTTEGDDEDDESDIFDASETCRLLRTETETK